MGWTIFFRARFFFCFRFAARLGLSNSSIGCNFGHSLSTASDIDSKLLASDIESSLSLPALLLRSNRNAPLNFFKRVTFDLNNFPLSFNRTTVCSEIIVLTTKGPSQFLPNFSRASGLWYRSTLSPILKLLTLAPLSKATFCTRAVDSNVLLANE